MVEPRGEAQLTAPIGTTDMASVLPMGVGFGRKTLNPDDLANQKLRDHGNEF
jgi:hypothetical protein